MSSLCTIFDVEGIDKAKLLSGLANEDFSDFEDCLQMECAKSYGADCDKKCARLFYIRHKGNFTK